MSSSAISERTGRTPKAGRNLPAAIGVGLILGGLIVASLIVHPLAFVTVVATATCVAVWELRRAFANSRIVVPLVPLFVATIVLPYAAYFGGTSGSMLAYVGAAVVFLLWATAQRRPGAVRDISGGLFLTAYVPLLASFAAMMVAQPHGVWRIVTFVAVVTASDTGGYAAGVLFGKHPMAPSVSPKKSWEGFTGSVILSVVVATTFVVFAFDGPWWVGVAFGVTAALTATVGDLSESLLKRDLDIKDMSNILPGHGGLMDRLDSLLVTAPVAYLFLDVLS